jgi:hypothetical protein
MHITYRLANQEGVRHVLEDTHRFCDTDVAIRLAAYPDGTVPLYPLHRVGDRDETQTQIRKADSLTASVSFHQTVSIRSWQPSVFATQHEH